MVDTRFAVSVQIMTSLAYRYGGEELMSSEDFGHILQTNPTFIRKLITKLVQANLVESFRGKGGGIKLARAPREITLKEIYQAVMADKRLVATHEKPAFKHCPVSCSMGQILCDVVTGMERSTLSYLEKQRLSDLVSKIK